MMPEGCCGALASPRNGDSVIGYWLMPAPVTSTRNCACAVKDSSRPASRIQKERHSGRDKVGRNIGIYMANSTATNQQRNRR